MTASEKQEIIISLLSIPPGELTDLMARIDCAKKVMRAIESSKKPLPWDKLRRPIAGRVRAKWGFPGGVKWLRGTLESLGYKFSAKGGGEMMENSPLVVSK